MPSTQVSLVIETEKRASRIELEAREKAQEIIDAANAAASRNRQNIFKNTDAQIENILSAAHDQTDKIFKEEENFASEMILSLQNTAASRKVTAIDAAVLVLTGKA